MPRTRKNHPPSLKTNVAVEAIRALKTTAQLRGCSAASIRRRCALKENRRWPVYPTSLATIVSKMREGRTKGDPVLRQRKDWQLPS